MRESNCTEVVGALFDHFGLSLSVHDRASVEARSRGAAPGWEALASVLSQLNLASDIYEECTLGDLRSMRLPAVVALRGANDATEFLLVAELGEGRVMLDSSLGRTTLAEAEFAQRWSGEVLAFSHEDLRGNVHEALLHVRYIPREDDVFIVTAAKSGTTFLQNLVVSLVHGFDWHTRVDHIDQLSPYFEYDYDASDYDHMSGRRVFKTHMPLDAVPSEGKRIYMLRHPKDVLRSWARHQRVSLEQYVKGCEGDPIPFWFDHFERSFEHRRDPNTLYLSYTSATRDVEQTVHCVAEFLGTPLLPMDASVIAHECEIDVMRDRRGKLAPRGRDSEEFPFFGGASVEGRLSGVEVSFETFFDARITRSLRNLGLEVQPSDLATLLSVGTPVTWRPVGEAPLGPLSLRPAVEDPPDVSLELPALGRRSRRTR